MGVVRGHVTNFVNFAPHHVFGVDEAVHVKFGMQLDIDEYKHPHDRLSQRECG